MQLLLTGDEGVVTLDFGQWLLTVVQFDLVLAINRENLTNWDKYLTETPSLTRTYNKPYKTRDLLLQVVQNLTCSGTNGNIVIEPSNVKYLPDFKQLSHKTFAKLVNYGTIDIKGCDVFTKVFNDFADNIDQYLHQYYQL